MCAEEDELEGFPVDDFTAFEFGDSLERDLENIPFEMPPPPVLAPSSAAVPAAVSAGIRRMASSSSFQQGMCTSISDEGGQEN